MAALTGSGGDIREVVGFLRREDMDESAPLSAADLRALIERMNARSDVMKDRIAVCLRSQYHQFKAAIAAAASAASQFESISAELDDILALFGSFRTNAAIADTPLDVEICELIQDMRNIRVDVRNQRTTLAVVQRISSLHRQLTLVEEALSQRKLVEAVEGLCKMKEALGISPAWEGAENKARPFTFLHNIWLSLFQKMHACLSELLAKAIFVDEDNSKLYITPEPDMEDDGASLFTILTSMDKIGVLDTALANLADMIFKSVMTAILKDPLKTQITEEVSPSEGKTRKHILRWASTIESQETMAEKNLYDKLLKVINFLCQHLCYGIDVWTMLLGRLIWPRLAEAIIAGYLSKAVPNDNSEVAQFQQLAALSKEFEMSLSSMKFIPQLDVVGDILGKFAVNADMHFASKRRKRILARVRRILVRSDFSFAMNKNMGTADSKGHRLRSRQNLSDESPQELLFQQETCVVSWAAKELLQIVNRVLEDCCISSPGMAVEFYYAARDALLLYRAIIPVKLSKELNSLTQEAVIFQNDCLYIANGILGLSYQYRDAIPVKLKETFMFVDLAQVFRQAAGEVLRQQICITKSDLDEALNHANGFRNTNNKQCYNNASNALTQVTSLLENVCCIWQPVLPQSHYIKSMGFLMNIVFQRVALDILSLDDMDVQETVQLRNLIFFLEESLSSQMQSLVVGDGDQIQARTNESSMSWSQRDELFPAWCKLMRLAELLDMSLISITHAWESGNLATCGFSSSEVQKLIKAVFSDTDLRKESLRRIQASKYS